jgi:tetratricopeptide (TPR) repeat protein
VKARELLDRSYETFVEVGDMAAAARAGERLANLDFHEGHVQDAVARLEQAYEALRADDEGAGGADLAAVAAELGRFLALGGEHERAFELVERALELAAALDLPGTLAGALNTKAMLLNGRGRQYEARLLFEGALALTLDRNLHRSAGRAFNNLADALEHGDLFAEAVDVSDRRLEYDRRLGNRLGETIALAAPVTSLMLLGRWSEALAHAGESTERATDAWTKALTIPAAAIHCERGELEQARQFLAGLAALEESDDLQTVSAYTTFEARLLRAEGRVEEALALADRAFTLCEGVGITAIISKLALTEALEGAAALGGADTARDRLALLDDVPPGHLTPFLRAQQARFRGRLAVGDADNDFRRAERLFRELETPFYVAVTLLEHGELLVAQGRPADAEPLLAEARDVFAGLEAAPWLDRVAAVAAGRSGVPA